MKRFRILSLLAALGLVASCDAPTGPRTGSLNLALLSESGTAAVVAVDEIRVRLSGPATREVARDVAAGAPGAIVLDDLEPGTYTVSVMGMVDGQVAHYGELPAVSVEAGRQKAAPVSFPAIQPVLPNIGVVDTVNVLRFTVAYGAVPLAKSYRVEWSPSPEFGTVYYTETPATATEITVPSDGQYYVRVRAINPSLTAPALPSPSKGVYLFQGISSVSVTPATPTVAAGATTQLAAEARDIDNAVVTGMTYVWVSSNTAVATVSTTGLVTGVAGGTATITALGKGTPGSATLTVTPRPAAKLAVIAQPTNSVAGATIPSIRVAVQDATGATVTGDNTTQVSLAIASNAAGNGALTGLATVSAVAGVATFSGLSIAQAGAGYTLAASASGLTGATTDNFDILPGAATQVTFSVGPSTTAAGAAISPAIQVTVRDASGNRVANSTAAVTLALGTNPSGGTLAGTRTVNATGGVASFSGLSIDKGGTGYTLTAAATGLSGATSAAFDVTAALPASQLAFTVQPASGTAGDALSPAIQVEVQNANGARITSANTPVTLAFAANPGSGTIIGTKTVNAINGIASFTGLTINKAATGYTLSATSAGLTGATSGAFNIGAAAPSRLRFVNALVNAKGNVNQTSTVAVAVTDEFDNVVTTSTANVTLGIGTNPWRSIVTGGGGTVSATNLTVAAVAGVATFAAVKIDKPGVGYTLAATAAGVSAGASNSFNVSVTFDGAISAAMEGSHTCAISTQSGTYCWGANGNTQLGVTTGNTQSDSIPSLVRGGLTFVKVTTGASHSCGLTAAGAAYCWGWNGYGQLGNNTTTDAGTPTAITGAGTLVFSDVVAGAYHTCGLTTASLTAAIDRQVFCWGSNSNGQLGNASNTQSLIPVRVAEPLQTTRTTAITAGGSHTCAIATTQVAYCWGYNGFGELGTADGVFTSTNVPTQVHALGTYTWTAITAGAYHTCGISSNGGNIARCWGYNYDGQVGDNSTTLRSIPTVVAGNLTNWVRIAAGSFHTCATSSSVGTQCWGVNYNGELGNGENASFSLIPSPVVGGLTFDAIDAGANHTCGRTATALYCWGYNGNGRLGSTGANTAKRQPTLVVQ